MIHNKIIIALATLVSCLLYFACSSGKAIGEKNVVDAKKSLEQQGWIQTPILTQMDTTAVNKKDKDVYVVMTKNDNSYVYAFAIFMKDSSGVIRNKPFGIVMERLFNSDAAYYKWESDSIVVVKLLKNGKLQANVQLTTLNGSTQNLEVLK